MSVAAPQTTAASTGDASRVPLVMYLGELATFLCEAGDFTPTYPVAPALSADAMEAFFTETDGGDTMPEGDEPVNLEGPSGNAGTEVPWRTVAAGLRPIAEGRDAVIVVPLSTSAAYQRALTAFLFSPMVRLRSVVMLSDVVSDSIACGAIAVSSPSPNAGDNVGHEGPAAASSSSATIVIQAGLAHITLAKVVDGSANKYSVSRVGSLQALSKAAGGVYYRAGTSAPRSLLQVDLHDERYRNELIAAFGFRPYTRALAAFRRRQQADDAATARPTRGKGHGKGAKRHRSSDEEAERAWRKSFSRHERNQPGVLEKLLMRVVGASALDPETPIPTILSGEALQVPLVQEILREVTLRCGDDRVRRAVAAETRAKERRQRAEAKAKARAARESHPSNASPGGADTAVAAPTSTPKSNGASRTAKRARKEQHPSSSVESGTESEADSNARSGDDEEGVTATDSEASASSASEGSFSGSSASSSGSDKSSESGDNENGSSSSDDDDSVTVGEGGGQGHGLCEQPHPFPDAPWDLPLLGGSLVAELPAGDLNRMRITEEEVKGSKGGIALWKAVL